MKARIIQNELVLIYKSDEHIPSIERIAQKLNVRIKVIPENSAGEKVGFLAGYGGFSGNSSTETADCPCMIFCGVTNKTLDKFLNALRENGINIPYKAVLTASNQNWTLTALLDELKSEHEKLGG